MKQQQGISLIEVLVALFVSAVGLMGIIKLEINSLQQAQDSYHFAVTNQLVNDLYERVRSNQKHAINQSGYASDFDEHSSAPETLCDQAACNESQLAAWDLYNWKQQVQRLLSDGKAQVVLTEADVNGRTAPKLTVVIDFLPAINDGDDRVQMTFETRI